MESDAFGLLTGKMVLGKSTSKVPGLLWLIMILSHYCLLIRPGHAFGCSSLVVFSFLPFLWYTQNMYTQKPKPSFETAHCLNAFITRMKLLRSLLTMQ
jgi:hypothetical protein